MTTMILIVVMTHLNHQEDGRQGGRDEEEAEAEMIRVILERPKLLWDIR